MISKQAANTILNALCGKSQYASLASNCYLGLSATEPETGDYTGGEIEPSGNGYARKFIGGYNTTASQYMANAANGVITNAQEIHFDEATGSWNVMIEGVSSPLRYVCIYASATGGRPLAWGKLGKTVGGEWQEEPVSPTANTVVVIKAGDLRISLT